MSQAATESYAIPKRLLLLMLLYIAASVSGLIAGQGVVFCLLTLIMVLAVLARHQAGLWALRFYTLAQLALVSFLPYILDQATVWPQAQYPQYRRNGTQGSGLGHFRLSDRLLHAAGMDSLYS